VPLSLYAITAPDCQVSKTDGKGVDMSIRTSQEPLRRRFLSGAAASAALAAPALAQGNSAEARLEFLAEGVVPFSPFPFVLSPTPPAIPPDVFALLMSGQLQARVRMRFPASRNRKILLTQVYITDPTWPIAAEQDPPQTTPPTLSLFETYIERVIVTRAPNEVLLAGTVVSNRIITPFGDLTGMASATSFGFSGEGQATLSMLGGIVAGSHATYCPIGYGRIRL
jgi:hypothetical protein